MMMVLEVLTGPDAGRSLLVRPGDVVRVGRALDCELALLADDTLALKQFSITGDGETYSMFHMSGNPTLWNGSPVEAHPLAHLDKILAGETMLRIFYLGNTEPPQPDSPVDRLLSSLRALGKPLFAVVDIKLEPWISGAASMAGVSARPLLLGHTEETLTEARPWVFLLTGSERFTAEIVRGCWSRGRVVFLCADEQIDGLVAALRPFLFLEDDTGELLGFRFFDPRAARALLPTLDPRYTDAFFTAAPVLLLEDGRPRYLWTYYAGSRGVRAVRLPLIPNALYLPSQADIRDRLRGSTSTLDAFAAQLVEEFRTDPIAAKEPIEDLLSQSASLGFQSLEARVQCTAARALLGTDCLTGSTLRELAGQQEADLAMDRFVAEWNRREAL